MKLFNDAKSPFGRKVLVACVERSIPVQEEFVDIYEPGPVHQLNALRQIPVLLTEDLHALFDSDVILAYLDSVQTGAPLIPTVDKWGILTRVSLGNGLMEAVLQRHMEMRRPSSEQSRAYIATMEARIWRVLSRMNMWDDSLNGYPLRADQIVIACALEYADLRFTHEWRDSSPRLRDWLAAISILPSMRATAPDRTQPISVSIASEGRPATERTR